MYSRTFPAALRLPVEAAIERVLRDHATGQVPGFALGDEPGELEVCILATGHPRPTGLPFTFDPDATP